MNKKFWRNVNVNNDKDLYSYFVLVVIEFRVFCPHGTCNTSNKTQIKTDLNYGTSGVHNAPLQHLELT
jgi:hypothetical protein